ncbi:MAG: DNA-binding protein, partial [Saccharolobus sp.]
MAKKSIFKACKNCKALVQPDQSTCPVCGNSSFT